MDRVVVLKKAKELFSKYRYVLLILLAGIALMRFPEHGDAGIQDVPLAETPVSPLSRAEELENILGQIDGVGKIRVLLTEADGAVTVYQTDEDRTSSQDSESQRVKTVIVTNSGREEVGLIRSVTPPVYLGAIIVCQGGDNPTIKYSIIQAVSSVTGITSDRITVLKMK